MSINMLISNVRFIMEDLKELCKEFILWNGWEHISTVMTVIGFFSIFLAILRFVYDSRQVTWKSNINIRCESYNYEVEDKILNPIYSSVWTNNPSKYESTIVFNPVDCVISKLKVIKYDENGKHGKIIKTYRNLTPTDAVCFRTELAECLPHYSLKWYSDYGEYCEFFFSGNWRNGINNRYGAVYHSTIWSTLRRIIGLK